MRTAVFLDLDNIKPKLDILEDYLLEIAGSSNNIISRWACANTPAVLTAYGSSLRKYKYEFQLAPSLEIRTQEVDEMIYRRVIEITDNPSKKLEAVFVVSNDNDYATLFKDLKSKGIATFAVGNSVGNILREAADRVFELDSVLVPKYFGIDLGTTNTVFARATLSPLTKRWAVSELRIPVPNSTGALATERTVPSSVRFEHPSCVIGGHVRSQTAAYKDRTYHAWKHDMGRVDKDGKPYTVIMRKEGRLAENCVVPLFLSNYEAKGEVLPEDAAGALLAYCKSKISQELNAEIPGIVITHPASYEPDAIDATIRAAVLAGWPEADVVTLPEPHAALYDFLHRYQEGELGGISELGDFSTPKTIMVYDLGGGTLDVTIHKVSYSQDRNLFDIDDIAIGTRTRVGGDLADHLITDFIVDYMERNKMYADKINSLNDNEREKLIIELQVASERFKQVWGAGYSNASDSEKKNFNQIFQYDFTSTFPDKNIPGVYLPINNDLMIEILEQLLCSDLSLTAFTDCDESVFNKSPFTDRMNTFVVPVIETMIKARLNTGFWQHLDAVLLNGGMTLFPIVRERLTDTNLLSNYKIIKSGDPEVAVARGAALFASGLQGKRITRICANNICLEVREGNCVSLFPLVKQGQSYPYRTDFTEKQFKIPDDADALNFNIWVGMGTKPGVNSTLQRSRNVPVSLLKEAKLNSGTLLTLEVEYKYDERIQLTLKNPDNTHRFTVEVDSKIHAPTLPVEHSKIKRNRIDMNDELTGFIDYHSISKQVESLAYNQTNENTAESNIHRDHMLRELISSRNRLDVCDQLKKWLVKNINYSKEQRFKEYFSFLMLRGVVNRYASDNKLLVKSQIESYLKDWITWKLGSVNDKNITHIINEIAETPGKLCWNGYENTLRIGFEKIKMHGYAESFMTSIGKVATPSQVLIDFLFDVAFSSNCRLGSKFRAVWATARLISPYQDARYKADTKLLSYINNLIIGKATNKHMIIEAQIVEQIANLLVQIAAWKLQGKSEQIERFDILENQLYLKRIRDLSHRGQKEAIIRTVENRLILLDQILHVSNEDLQNTASPLRTAIIVLVGD